MELAGFLACALIGVSLGLIGAGGSILMVPVLVFLFHMPPLLATSYSLFVVGGTSGVSAFVKFQKGEVLRSLVLTFSLTSMIIVFVIRHYILPGMPEYFNSRGNTLVSYELLCMVLFACLMISSALFMLSKAEQLHTTGEDHSKSLVKIIPYALLVGTITGFLGAGGGFIIIPVMTLLLRVHIKKAIGTSLGIVALNSLCGFANDLGYVDFNWNLLILITIIALIGSILGLWIANKIDAKKLKACFAWFVLSLGILIITVEFYGIVP